MEYIRELFDYSAEWRYRRTVVIRFLVSVLFLFLFLFCFNHEWQEIKPITGYYNGYITVQGVAVKNDIRTLEKALSILPEWIVESHRGNGQIYLRSEAFQTSDYTEYGETHTTIGTFQRKDNVISILILEDKEKMQNTLLHEYGHYLDNLFSCTESLEFQKIYQAEKDNYFEKIEESTYHVSCESEYFAGAFRMYFTQGKALKKYCPLTYEYLQQMIERK